MDDSPQVEGVVYDTDLSVIDRDQLEMLLMADEGEDAHALVTEIFEIFKAEGREKLQNLEVVCQTKSLAELRTMLHFVAGSAGNLGLLRLHGFFRGIELAIESGRFDPPENCASIIRAEFDAACLAFGQELL